jgi:hypothetical protein
MKTILRLSYSWTLLLVIWIFFTSSVALPTEPINSIKKEHLSKAQKSRVEKLEKRLEGTVNLQKRAKIEKRLRKINYGQQGDALGLAALVGAILSILLSLAVLLFLGIDWQLLVFIGLLLGAAAIIIGIVDLRYTDMPGQAYAAMVAGGLGIIAGIIALIVVK